MTAEGIRFLFRQPLDTTGVGSISALRRVLRNTVEFDSPTTAGGSRLAAIIRIKMGRQDS
jgi:hypothetical protein